MKQLTPSQNRVWQPDAPCKCARRSYSQLIHARVRAPGCSRCVALTWGHSCDRRARASLQPGLAGQSHLSRMRICRRMVVPPRPVLSSARSHTWLTTHSPWPRASGAWRVRPASGSVIQP